MACQHDPRFQGITSVFGIVTGCVACELESTERQRKSLEAQLVWLSQWCKAEFGVDTNAMIGREGWPKTVAEVVTKVVDDFIRSNGRPTLR